MKVGYASAGEYPFKLLHNRRLCEYIRKHKIIPMQHLLLEPTNKCNANCSFCVSANRPKNLELSLDPQIRNVRWLTFNLDCKAITLTGGGEPTLHPHFWKIVSILKEFRLALTTNGLTWKGGENRFDWVRFSLPEKADAESWVKSLVPYRNEGLSIVLANFGDRERAIILKNNLKGFSHLRVTANELNPEYDFPESDKVVFQDRLNFQKGQNPCYVSLLRPVVAADGYMYPCCNAQIATGFHRWYPEEMRMGKIEDMRYIYREQRFFDGSKCVRCYFHELNRMVKALLADVVDVEFL